MTSDVISSLLLAKIAVIALLAHIRDSVHLLDVKVLNLINKFNDAFLNATSSDAIGHVKKSRTFAVRTASLCYESFF